MRETFIIDGKEYQYPCSFCNATEENKLEYRIAIGNQYRNEKAKEHLKNLPLKEKARRYVKNISLKLLASGLEAIFVPLMIGGVTVKFEGIRDKKESTLMSYNKEK